MKKLLLLFGLGISFLPGFSQISITADDMPVNHDTLRYSLANPIGFNFDRNDTGANKTWDYSQLIPILQGVDTYRKASDVNLTYGFTISSTAFGTKIADSIPNLGSFLPITIKDIYNFYNEKSNPSRFIVEAYAANIGGIPLPANYSDPDEWYYFPLTYGNRDTGTFAVNINIPSIGGLKMTGTRTTLVDGWGQITTPFFNQPVSVIRVKTTAEETDSINFNGIGIGIPRTTVDYKFLSNEDHYPVLWVSANVLAGVETITSVRYRDEFRPLGISANPPEKFKALVYPNPVHGGVLHLSVSDNGYRFRVDVFDMTGRLVTSVVNQKEIDFGNIPAGNYLIRVIGNQGTAYEMIVN